MAWLAGFVSVNAAANLIGVRFTARVYKGLLVLELLTLALFVIFGALALHRGAGAGGLTLAPLYDAHNFSLTTVAGATSIAVLSFLGFDGISTLAEESTARNAVARATVLSLVLIGALFMLQTWIAADLGRGMRFDDPSTAFYDIAARAGGTPLRLISIVAIAVSFGIANAMAAQAAVSRVLFAMARDRKLPAILAVVNPRFKTPYVSTLLVAAVSLIVGLFFASRIDDLTRVVNFGALTSFALLHLAVAYHHFFRQRSGAWLRHLIFPLAGFAVILSAHGMDRTAKILGGCWLAAGVLYYLILAARGRTGTVSFPTNT